MAGLVPAMLHFGLPNDRRSIRCHCRRRPDRACAGAASGHVRRAARRCSTPSPRPAGIPRAISITPARWSCFASSASPTRFARSGCPASHPFDVAYFTRLERLRDRARPHAVARRAAEHARCAARDRPVAGADPSRQPDVCRAAPVRRGEPPAEHHHALRLDGRRHRRGRPGRSLRARRATASSRRARVAYAVGCDGSRSTVRKALGIRYEGEDHLMNVFMGGEFVSIHMAIPGLYEALGPRRAWMYLTDQSRHAHRHHHARRRRRVHDAQAPRARAR